MAYNKDEIFKQACEAVEKNNLFFIEDIVAWLPISKPTLYEFFPPESNELNNLKDLLNTNKIKTKSAIRAKLYKSDKAGELLALYRIICDDHERQKLNQQYIEMRQKHHDRELTPEEAKQFAMEVMRELTKCDETIATLRELTKCDETE